MALSVGITTTLGCTCLHDQHPAIMIMSSPACDPQAVACAAGVLSKQLPVTLAVSGCHQAGHGCSPCRQELRNHLPSGHCGNMLCMLCQASLHKLLLAPLPPLHALTSPQAPAFDAPAACSSYHQLLLQQR